MISPSLRRASIATSLAREGSASADDRYGLTEGVEAAKAQLDTANILRLKDMTLTFISCRLGMIVPPPLTLRDPDSVESLRAPAS